MTIHIKRFGEILNSRPDGREAALTLLASGFDLYAIEIEIDFAGILVMTPSWLGEFIDTLNKDGLRKFSYTNAANASVRASIDAIEELSSQ